MLTLTPDSEDHSHVLIHPVGLPARILQPLGTMKISVFHENREERVRVSDQTGVVLKLAICEKKDERRRLSPQLRCPRPHHRDEFSCALRLCTSSRSVCAFSRLSAE